MGGGTPLGRWSRTRAAYAHAHRAPFGTLGRVRARRGRRRLGAGSLGTRAPSHATDRAEARRSRFCRFTGRQGVHHRQQRGVGPSGGRARNGPRRRACSHKAHNRVLHGRIDRTRLMHAFDVLRAPGVEVARAGSLPPLAGGRPAIRISSRSRGRHRTPMTTR